MLGFMNVNGNRHGKMIRKNKKIDRQQSLVWDEDC